MEDNIRESPGIPMYEYGTTEEQMARVAVKNRKNACSNPFAQYQEEVSMEEVLGSPMIIYPISLYSCCLSGDGEPQRRI
jgi:acetyl-CoA acetyltransferase